MPRRWNRPPAALSFLEAFFSPPRSQWAAWQPKRQWQHNQPPSWQWPKAGEKATNARPAPPASRAPQQVRAEAQERVERLEAVLSTYGGVENAETASLKEMIRRGEGQGQDSSHCRSHQELRRVHQPGHQEIGKSRGRGCEGNCEEGSPSKLRSAVPRATWPPCVRSCRESRFHHARQNRRNWRDYASWLPNSSASGVPESVSQSPSWPHFVRNWGSVPCVQGVRNPMRQSGCKSLGREVSKDGTF